jgi:uncharacterized protein
MISIHQSDGSITFAVRIHPRARQNAITGEFGDALKLSLTAPPVDGKANTACIDFFAKLLNVTRSSVTIASGQNCRDKVIRIIGVNADELQARIAL